MKITKLMKLGLLVGVFGCSVLQAKEENTQVLLEKGIFLQETKKDYAGAFKVFEQALPHAADALRKELLYRMVVTAEKSGDQASKEVAMESIGVGEAPTKVLKVRDVILKATMEDDLKLFHSVCDKAMREAITKRVLSGVSAQVTKQMEAGYEVSYLGVVDRLSYKQYFWKIRYTKHEEEEFTLEISLNDKGRVIGCLLK